jgi:hypothetical protein
MLLAKMERWQHHWLLVSQPFTWLLMGMLAGWLLDALVSAWCDLRAEFFPTPRSRNLRLAAADLVS